jgi:hypothetical protein
MSHHLVHIKASAKQLSKLRKGHKVRISPAVEGTGFNLLIDPDRYSVVSRTFNKGKGMEIQLSPQEILTNQEATPHMEGTGIFGKRFDRFLEKRGLRDVAYKVGDQLKPAFKTAVLGGIAAGTAGLAGLSTFGSGGTLAPLAPYLAGLGAGGAYLANDYIDNPNKYHDMLSSNAGGPRNPHSASTLAGQMVQNELLKKLNQETGNNYGALSQANIENAIAHKARASMEKSTIGNQLRQLPNSTIPELTQPISRSYSNLDMSAFGRGFGLHKHHNCMRGGSLSKSKADIGLHGSFVSAQQHLPQALLSQPFSANFQFQHTLPPAYQKYSKGTAYA